MVEHQLTIVIAVISRYHQCRHILLGLRCERKGVKELSLFLARKFGNVVVRLHLLLFHTIDFGSDIPHVFFLIEYIYIFHMILAVYACLNLEQIVRISDVSLEAFRHLFKGLEQGRVNLCKCGCYRVLIVYDIEIYITIICIHNHLYGISDVVNISFAIRFRIRVVGAECICINHPVQLAVNGDHVRVILIVQIRHYSSYSLHHISVDNNLRAAVNIG